MSEELEGLVDKTLSKRLSYLTMDELGGLVADEQRRTYSTIISKNTSMAYKEVYNKFLDREDDAIEASESDSQEWAIRMAAQDIIVETIIEGITGDSR